MITPSSRLLSRIVSIALLFLLLLFPALSVQGAAGGLLLWFNIVLPTLSPFMICTQMVVSLGGTNLLIRPVYPILHALFGLSTSGTFVLFCGMLCGYPLGAKMCADFLLQGKISRTEASYLLSICNHPSPMFLLGYCMGQLKMAVSPGVLLTCLYLPLLPLSILSRRFYDFRPRRTAGSLRLFACGGSPTDGDTIDSGSASLPPSMEEVLLSTAETMVIIGGYIMLFSILAVWILQIRGLPPVLSACLNGAAEITTGIHRLCTVLPPQKAVFPVIAAVAFGGFSGIFQTKSVIKNAGLSIRHYLFWKIIHTLLACGIFILLSVLLPLS